MKNLFILLSCLLLASCANNLHFEMPQGPQGLSAYDLWVTEVKNGSIEWDSDQTDLNDFFRYLKGEKGDDGQSAYELWVEQVEKGIQNPHNPGENWPKNETDHNDFWWFLTGKDGKDGKPGLNGKDGVDGLSAWELWKRDVADGLENPHDPGNDWPKDQTGLEDFWEYLRGEDGNDGEMGSLGEVGKPGETIKIIPKVPNVIPLYQLQGNNEFVNWTDGSVTYQVYNNVGKEVGAGVKVTGMPGVNPEYVFTTDDAGKFKIYKDSLPRNKSLSERSGTTQVTYIKIGENNEELGEVTEPSANNTYVPEKIEIRFRMRTPNAALSGGNVIINTIVERKTEVGKEWEVIPSYLGDLERPAGAPATSSYIKLYWAEKGNPDRPFYTTSPVNLSSVNKTFSLSRPRVKSDYVDDAWEDKNNPWNGTHRYCTYELDSYYGEKARLMAYDETGVYDVPKYVVLHKAPIQRLPVIKDVKMGAPHKTNTGEDITEPTEGVFDLEKVQYQYFYNLTLKREDIGDEAWFTAEPMGDAAANDLPLLGVGFTLELESGKSDAKTGDQLLKLEDPWKISAVVYDGAKAYVYTTNTNQFVGVNVTTEFTFGTLSFGGKVISGLAVSPDNPYETTIPAMPIQFP